MLRASRMASALRSGAPHSVLDSRHAPCGRGRLQRPRASVASQWVIAACRVQLTSSVPPYEEGAPTVALAGERAATRSASGVPLVSKLSHPRAAHITWCNAHELTCRLRLTERYLPRAHTAHTQTCAQSPPMARRIRTVVSTKPQAEESRIRTRCVMVTGRICMLKPLLHSAALIES